MIACYQKNTYFWGVLRCYNHFQFSIGVTCISKRTFILEGVATVSNSQEWSSPTMSIRYCFSSYLTSNLIAEGLWQSTYLLYHNDTSVASAMLHLATSTGYETNKFISMYKCYERYQDDHCFALTNHNTTVWNAYIPSIKPTPSNKKMQHLYVTKPYIQRAK